LFRVPATAGNGPAVRIDAAALAQLLAGVPRDEKMGAPDEKTRTRA
jgi:hypothetical protein